MIRFLKFLKGLFSKDLGWKTLSLVIALFLWFVVMNIINPTETKNFVTDIEFKGLDALEEKGFTIYNVEEMSNTRIDVKVNGTRPALDDLKNTATDSKITTIADLSTINVTDDMDLPRVFSVKVNPSVNNSYIYSYEITSCNPAVVDVYVDKLSNTKRIISLSSKGKPAAGFVADSPECTVTSVNVKGPASRIGEISKIQAEIDISGKNASFSQVCPVKVYDVENNELTDFRVEPESVNVKVDIMSIGTIKINQPITTGKLPEGLKQDSIEWSPKTITVQGKTADLENMASVNLPPIDLDTISSSASFTYNVSDLIGNPSIISDTKSIVVTINVSAVDDEDEKSASKIELQPENIKVLGIDSNTNSYVIENIDVELIGSREEIEKLTVAELNPVINLTGIGKGKHSVTVNLSLPDGIIAVKNFAEVTLSDGKNNKPDAGGDTEPATEGTTAIPPITDDDINTEEETEQQNGDVLPQESETESMEEQQ